MTRSPDDMSVRSQIDTLKALRDLSHVVEPRAAAPDQGHLDALANTVSALAEPPRIDDVMDDDAVRLELLKTLELHGNGLTAYDPSAPADTGDVLVATDRSVWLVTAVDKDGKVTGLAGFSPGKRKRIPALRWRQSTARRAWLHPGQSPSSAYRDVAKALSHLVRLWGESWIDGRELAAYSGWFVEVLEAPGLGLRHDGLCDTDDTEAVVAFCERRGGLVPVSPSMPLTPGDLVRLDARTGWGIVSRTAPDGLGPVDVLVCPPRGKGPLGEDAGAVRFVRGHQPTTANVVWRPAAYRRSPSASQ